MKYKKLSEKVKEGLFRASFVLRKDILSCLKKAYSAENNKRAKKALSWIIDNAKIAADCNIAICQDTGLPIVFLEIGKNTEISSAMLSEIQSAIDSGYRKFYLRHSVVDPLTRGKSSYKIGTIFHFDFSPKLKGLRLSILPKGFGCENKSRLKMFNPTVSLSEIENFILESVKMAGPEACPPFIVGVGIGGTSDYALSLAKKALLKKIDQKNSDPQLALLEKKILKRINSLGIGPMGFGGKTTALAVKIEKAPTHIAGLPVGVNISCHALRSSTITL